MCLYWQKHYPEIVGIDSLHECVPKLVYLDKFVVRNFVVSVHSHFVDNTSPVDQKTPVLISVCVLMGAWRLFVKQNSDILFFSLYASYV